MDQMTEVKDRGYQILLDRKQEIVNDRLDGTHWFLAVVRQAVSEVAARHAA